MKKYVYCVLFVLAFFACKMPIDGTKANSEQKIITLINWNLQTFFDAVDDGTEYADFRGSSSSWNEQKYKERLKTLCSFIEETQADVYVFQEIEKSSILQDISNELVALRSMKKGYTYSAFSKNQDEALGIAILSRFPLKDTSTHHIDLSVALGLSNFETSKQIVDGTPLEQPSLRVLLHSKIEVDENKSFSLFSCHWKSKFGGAEKSEVWRNAQERLLADTLLLYNEPFIITGDFNRTLEEFLMDEKNTDSKSNLVQLQGSNGSVPVISSWLVYRDIYSDKGSYYYQGEWEKIDHIFYSENFEIVDFQTVLTDTNATIGGFPMRYDVFNGKGASDHLPLLCVIEL